MQPGQFLINKDGGKRKILGVCGEAIIVSRSNDFEFATYPATKKELQDMGWSLLKKPWEPTKKSNYFYIVADGQKWYKKFDGDKVDEFNLLIGNCARTEADAELYKQKLIERMGKDFDKNYYRVGIDLASGKDRSVNS